MFTLGRGAGKGHGANWGPWEARKRCIEQQRAERLGRMDQRRRADQGGSRSVLRWGGKLAAHPSVLGHGGRRDAAAWRSLGLAPRHSASVYLPALTPAAGRPLTTRAAAGRRGAEARRVGVSRRHLLPELLPSARARTSATHPGHAALAARREAALACQWHRAPGSPLSEVQGFIPASAGNHAQGPPATPRWGGAAQVPRHVGPRSLPFLPRPPHLEAANSVVMTGSARRDFEHKNHARTFENPDAQAALWSIKSEFLRWKGAQEGWCQDDSIARL
ncbi:uncharacterized protein [Equus przewalskii]|uniref:Uncharacterized protein isoform X1 n=2 Tax=Equus przewalskii TaxID=9798 RepID=A0ABM4QB67_EQUPR